MLRTYLAGNPRADLAGSIATLTGWAGRRCDHGGVILIDMCDHSGYAQVVLRNSGVAGCAHHPRSEYCIQATGAVEERLEGPENPNPASGEIKVSVTKLTTLNESAALSFQLEDVGTSGTVGEEARLKYRYLNLHREDPVKVMRLRAAVNRAVRKVLDSYDLTEIEVPTLTRSTSEGVHDFVVPARLKPGTFYALSQPPQLFRQLPMVAGMEHHYQIARHYRDEDFHVDHQPEFTQLDVEMSFAEQDDVIALTEEILVATFAEVGVTAQTPIPRMTSKEAMEKYGSDKPDLCFDIPLVECTEFFKDTIFHVFQNDYVGTAVMDEGVLQPRRQLDAWQDWARQRGAKGPAYILVGEDGTLGGLVAKNITDAEREGIAAYVGAKPGDRISLAAGDVKSSRALLGAARGEVAKKLGLIREDDWAFTQVVDASLFEPVTDATTFGDVTLGHSQRTVVYHVFTSPKPEHMDTFGKDPGNTLAYAYDTVCNGNEIGGGSIRIHRPDAQKRVLDVMGVGEEEAQEQFGFLLNVFQYGAPPHGGIAFGWDRIVSLLAGVDSIREVIAFSKSSGGVDSLTDASTPIIAQQRKEAGIDFKSKPKPKADGAKAAAGAGDSK